MSEQQQTLRFLVGMGHPFEMSDGGDAVRVEAWGDGEPRDTFVMQNWNREQCREARDWLSRWLGDGDG